jgi:peptide/nickel transport system substrate-binding protein
MAFSQPRADALGVEWMNFIDGASLLVLKSYLDNAKATGYIPYEPTMGQYVTEVEAAERWSNLEEWYSDKGHFWVGSGPFYLESADTGEKVVHLERFADYPDTMDRWLFLLEPLA